MKVKCITISALTDEGIDQLVYAIADLVEKTPVFPLFDAESDVMENKVYTLDDEEKPFEIKHPDLHTWVITGDKIIKFYRMTNISTDEGMMVLLTRLRKLRIDDILEEMGAEDGDTVILDDFAFDFYK